MAWRIFLATGAIAIALSVLYLDRAGQVVMDAGTWVDLPPPLGPEDKLLLDGDGQFYAMLAQDPTLARPEVFNGVGNQQAAFAYRAMRPGYGWMAWMMSIGQPTAVPWALIGLTVASTVALAAAVMDLAGAAGQRMESALLVALIPGVIHLLSWTGPEILAAACACAGTAAVLRGRDARAAAWFAGSVLLRETLLLVVVALVLARCWRSRWAVAPGIALAAWVAVVVVRVGSWPTGASPFASGGIVDAAPDWDRNAVAGLIFLGMLTACAALRHPVLVASLVGVHAVLGAVMAEAVWSSDGFPRVLLPLYAVLLALAGPWDHHDLSSEASGSAVDIRARC